MRTNDIRGARDLRRGGSLRAGLALTAATVLSTGLWALASPRSFYDTFPFPGWCWVSTPGPYKGHLIRDYGAMNLAQNAAQLVGLGVQVALPVLLLVLTSGRPGR